MIDLYNIEKIDYTKYGSCVDDFDVNLPHYIQPMRLRSFTTWPSETNADEPSNGRSPIQTLFGAQNGEIKTRILHAANIGYSHAPLVVLVNDWASGWCSRGVPVHPSMSTGTSKSKNELRW